MAQIKITVTLEATYMIDAHAAVDAMDALLRTRGGSVVRARLVHDLDAIVAIGGQRAPLVPCHYCVGFQNHEVGSDGTCAACGGTGIHPHDDNPHDDDEGWVGDGCGVCAAAKPAKPLLLVVVGRDARERAARTIKAVKLPVDVKVGLDAYVVALAALMAAHGDTRSVVAQVNAKYAKVVRDGDDVYSYVDLATGDVLKGNWKGVERAVIHIKRGNVCNGSWLDWHGPYGIGYADQHGSFRAMIDDASYMVAIDAIQQGDGARAAVVLQNAISDHKARKRAAALSLLPASLRALATNGGAE